MRLTPPTAAFWAQWAWAEVCARVLPEVRDPVELAAVQRAWLEQRPDRWLRAYLPGPFSAPYTPGAPRSVLAAAIAAIPWAHVGRAQGPILAEMGRGLGKTQTTLGMVLMRLIVGADDGALLTSQRADDAQAGVNWVQRLGIPPYRERERATSEDVREWLRSPLGVAYPRLRWSGGAQHLTLHRGDGAVAHLWARGASAKIRGLNAGGVRPTLVVADDLVSSSTGWSDAVTRERMRYLEDELAGLGYTIPPCPAVVLVLANAMHADDLPARLTAKGWRTLRGSVWRAPDGSMALGLPRTDDLAALLSDLRALGTDDERIAVATDALRAAPGLLAGYVPADPAHTPALLLSWQAAFGDRAFGRIFCCARFADSATLWPWAQVARVDTVAPDDVLTVGVWLDPRYSEDQTRNDFAAAAAVGRLRSGRRVVLAVEEARCGVDDARALYWRALDRALALVPEATVMGGAESNGGLAPYLARDFAADADLRHAQRRPAVCPDLLPSSASKYGTDRLDRLTGPIERGDLAILRGALSEEGERQCLRLGTGYHDDVPDAIERADALACPAQADPLEAWARSLVGR